MVSGIPNGSKLEQVQVPGSCNSAQTKNPTDQEGPLRPWLFWKAMPREAPNEPAGIAESEVWKVGYVMKFLFVGHILLSRASQR